jgi:hypothetical protein
MVGRGRRCCGMGPSPNALGIGRRDRYGCSTHVDLGLENSGDFNQLEGSCDI